MKARILAALCALLLGLTGCIKGSKNFFYVTGPGTTEVFGFTLHSDGSLTPLGSPNFTTGSGPASLAIHPPGDFFYIGNSAGNNITLLDINSGNGELTVPPTNSALPPLTPANIFNAGTTPISMAVAPNAPRLYVANRDSGDISAFLIDPTNGNLGLVNGSPFPLVPVGVAVINPQSLAISPKGDFLYTANPAQGSISEFAIASDGTLTQLPGSPIFIGGNTAGISPSFVTVHPSGKFVYVADPTGNEVLAFAIQANGTLSEINGFNAGSGPGFLSITPQGSFLFASNFADNTVSVYAIDSNSGALGQVSGSPFATGGNGPGFVLATGAFVYVADKTTNDIAAFAIGDKGVLTPVKGSPFSVPVSPTWLSAVAEGQ